VQNVIEHAIAGIHDYPITLTVALPRKKNPAAVSARSRKPQAHDSPPYRRDWSHAPTLLTVEERLLPLITARGGCSLIQLAERQ